MANKLFESILNESSVEEDLASIERGGFEAFTNEEYEDPYKAREIHKVAQESGMSDLDYINNEERLEKLYDENEAIADLEEFGKNNGTFDLFLDENLNDIHRSLLDQAEELANDPQYENISIGSYIRDYIDEDIWDISSGNYYNLSDFLSDLEKYKDDERTPVCRALYSVFTKVKNELNEVYEKY